MPGLTCYQRWVALGLRRSPPPCGEGLGVGYAAFIRCVPMKAVRTDSELECPGVDAGLLARGVDLVTLPDGVPEEDFCRAVADADLLLMCYTPVTARVIESAPKLRGIVKYGVGIDAIDIPAATRRGIPVVNVPEYA